jgi:hypothetical protein
MATLECDERPMSRDVDNHDTMGRSAILWNTTAAAEPQQMITPAAISVMAVAHRGTMMRT